MSLFQRFSCRTWLLLTGVLAPLSPVLAQGYGGPIPAIPGTPSAVDKQGVRNIILNALTFVLDFLALAAVVFIVIAGIRLIVSQGSDTQKDAAKKTILFVIIGLLVILFSRVIVGFFTDTIPREI
ncbi:hypothetical protein EXS70_04495 [Candidatus Peribacteria bacterium]|nr:hypothetical protein [Candidatus Peribacteria bacterium]